MTAHHKLGASSAHRWMVCTKSVEMEAGLPETSSPYADEGSVAHQLLDFCLKLDKEPQQYIGVFFADWPDIKVDEDMADYIEGVISRAKLSAKDGMLWPEQQVDYGPWAVEGAFGTSDVITYIPEDNHLIITDLKYGKGVKVEASDNEQLCLYALGSYNMLNCMYDIDTVTMIIDQPRLDHYSVHTMSLEELLEFGEHSRQKALEVENNPMFNPDNKACQWCKAKSTCKALADYLEDVISADFEDLEDQDPDQLSRKQLSEILLYKDMIEKWLSALKDRAVDEIKSGNDVPGFKLVSGRSIRRWGDEAKAEKQLRKKLKVAEIFTKKLISPAKAEKKLGKRRSDILGGLVIKPQGAPTLALESDKRRALSFDTEDDFEDISDGEEW